MNDPLDKYRRQVGQPGNEEETELATPDGKTYQPYRPSNKARRLVLLPRKHSHCAPAYSYLIDMFWNPDGLEISLMYTHARVVIKGKNLVDLARQLAAEKVAFIQEFDPGKWDKPADGETVITFIEYRLNGPAPGGEGKSTAS